MSIKLDPFHAIQRFRSKIPKKGGTDTLRRLQSQMVHDFTLILRDPADTGVKRTIPAPSELVLEKTLKTSSNSGNLWNMKEQKLFASVPLKK